MKGIVVELKNDKAAVLSDDGCVTKIKNKSYEIGQVIQLEKPGIKIPGKIAAFAASAAACIILGTGAWAYASPYTYVSVDVNPSVEFTANRFDRIIGIKALNDDGKKLLKEISMNQLKNKTISDAIINTVDHISDDGYFETTEEGSIVIATSSENLAKAENLAEDLKQSVEQQTEENGNSVEINVFSVSPALVKEAKELGATPGKLRLIEKLRNASNDPDSVNIKEWLDRPVKEIMKATKEYSKNNKNQQIGKKEIVKESSAPKVNEGAADVDNNKNINSNKQNNKDQDKTNQKKHDNKNKSDKSASTNKSGSQNNNKSNSNNNKKTESNDNLTKNKNSEQTSKNTNSSKNNVSDETGKSDKVKSADNTPKDNISEKGGNNTSENTGKKDESTKDKDLSGSGTPDKSTQQPNGLNETDTSSKGNTQVSDNTNQNGASDKNTTGKSQNSSNSDN